MTLAALRRSLAASRRHPSAFFVLGDPSPALSVELAVAAVEAGVTMLEFGIPFSDPCADGPAVQAACGRARAAGVSTDRAFEILAAVHARLPDVPKNLLVYGNLVHARGWRRFCSDLADAGGSTLLVPDVPPEESGPLRVACREAGLGHVSLVAPNTTPDRLALIDAQTDGFVYLASLQGVTGSASATAEGRAALVRRVSDALSTPVCVGFGLARATDLHSVFDAGAQIAVVGSHLARVIESSVAERADVVARVRTACADLIHPTPTTDQTCSSS